ncbi:MiaB/RimO family radical SAM methylthiotransferase [uncultured Desulfovibrio sp.]|uniref:MiaB/RimO family radical SAM methylthiotransferase n=1 Tax=uncultured Desulfovibrio sp. TaxID=167968 RepID=UPI00260ABAB6|nr:MiaB/RimO family radical SAM methylthiotransferase [uncultured Desulfovibrio sp.]
MCAWKFHFVTFGCKVNQYETQALREAWTAQGGTECDSPDAADVVCINSCAITARGERDARNALFRVRRDAPGARVLLTGCAARLVAGQTAAGRDAPDAVIVQEAKSRLLAGPESVADGLTDTADADAAFPPFEISGFRRARPVLKVQDGCRHRCTYCIVPLTRGACRSRDPFDAIREARRLLEAGYAELMISGINLRQYGRDKAEYGDFWSLLQRLDAALAPEFAGRARLRISSLEPSQLDARGLDILRGCRMVCPHLHISLQHASPAVLRRMGRGHYSADMLEQAVHELRAHWPVMALGADLLLGFPGESEEDARCLLDFVERMPFSYAHVFPYSRRPGTAADRMDGQLPQQLKQERAARVRAAVTERQEAFREAQLRLPRLLAAPEAPMQDGRPRNRPFKGVNEYYVPCLLPPEAAQAAETHRLIPVRPLELTPKGLRVALLDEAR